MTLEVERLPAAYSLGGAVRGAVPTRIVPKEVHLRPSQTSRTLPYPGRGFYGWTIVLIAACALYFSSPGQSYSISEFVNSYLRDFHLSRVAVSGLYSGATLLSGSLLFIVGRAIDRYGHRATTAVITALLAATCIANSFAFSATTLFFGFFALRFFGQGSMTLLPNTLVPQWFQRLRGRAISLMGIGSIVGAAVVPPLNAWLIAHVGWQATWRLWGVGLLLFLPLAVWLVRDTPEQVGLLPDGQAPSGVEAEGTAPGEDVPSWTLAQAGRTRSFWFLMFCVLVPSLVSTGITFQMFSLLGSDHIATGAIAGLLSLNAIAGFVGTLAGGYLLDRFPIHKIVPAGFALMLLQLVVLLNTHRLWEAVLFAVIWGISSSLLTVALNVIWPAYFGRRHLGTIRGVAMTAMVVGSALGPLPFGWAYDQFGGYQQVLLVMMILPAAAAVLSLLSPPPSFRHSASDSATASSL